MTTKPSDDVVIVQKDCEKVQPELDAKTFEEILEDLGCFGPFQALILFLYMFLEIAAAFVVFIPICVARSTSTFENCTDLNGNSTSSENETSVIDSSVNVTTDNSSTFPKSLLGDFEHVFQAPFQYESIVDEWDLKCDRAWIPDIFTSCLMAGMFTGSLFFGQIADWYGRRPAYLCVLGTLFGGTLLAGMSPNIYVYAVARFICGAGYVGFTNVSCMAVMEFMTPKWRSLANMIGPIGEGVILLSVLGYLIRPWRMLYFATLAPYLLSFPIYFLLPESPRWLLRNKKVKEAHEVLGYMAKINERQPVSMAVLEALRKQEEQATEAQVGKHISYGAFFKTRQLRTPALFLFGTWFAWNVGFYGISYNIRNVPGNTYLNLGLLGLATAIGQRCSMPANERFGRRRAVLYGMTLSAMFLVALAVGFLTLQEVSPKLVLSTCFVGLLGLSSTRSSLKLLAGESFPTAVRTMALGLSGLGANIAGLVTPQVAYLGSIRPSLPFFIFAVVSVLGSLVVLMMKETSGQALSDEVQKNKKKSVEENSSTP